MMGRLIEEQAVIDCLTNTAKYYELEDADKWTKGIHYGLLHGLDNILDNVPTVEAIPKDQYEELIKTNNRLVTDNNELRASITMMRLDYEAKLKADIVAMLEELQLEMEELPTNRTVFTDSSGLICYGYSEYAPTAEDASKIIQQKIDKLRGDNG